MFFSEAVFLIRYLRSELGRVLLVLVGGVVEFVLDSVVAFEAIVAFIEFKLFIDEDEELLLLGL